MRKITKTAFRWASLLMLVFGISINLTAQEFEVRSYAGATYYLGDLAPYSHNLSSSQGKFTAGVSFGWKFDEVFTLSLKYLSGTIVGDDNYSKDPIRRKRNLNFFSNINEYGLVLDVYVTTVVPDLKKYGLDFYLTTGFNIFTFNPKTYYDGELIELQPLGTEGQGIASFKTPEKYKLVQPSFAIGVGLDFSLTKNIKLGIEVAPRLTWTDYIDDVSGHYIGTTEQMDEQGQLTAKLANRLGEYANPGSGEIIEVVTGDQRGDSKDNDWYLMTLGYISYRFGGPVAAIKKAEEMKVLEEKEKSK